VLFGHATLTITRPWDDDQVVLVSSIKAMTLRLERAFQEVDRHQARWLFDGMDRLSRSGLRGFLSEARLSSFPVSSLDDHEICELVRQCIADGRVVAVRKRRGESGRATDATGEQRHLVRAVEALTRGRLEQGGRRYKLVADADLAAMPGRNEYVVLSRDVAQRVLDDAARAPGTTADLGALLAQARSTLSKDWQPPVGPDGMVLLRKEIGARTVSVIEEPAISPSRMRKLMDRTWYEVSLVDEIGEAISGVELRIEIDGELYNGKTDAEGKLRLANAIRGEAKVRLVEPQAVLDLLDERWAEDRPEDWIVPSDDDTVLEVCRGASDWRHSVDLLPETPRIVIMEPPYWVRLYGEHDELMTGIACKVAVGGQTYEATSDAQGWIEFPVGQQCPESATVEWQRGGITYGMEVKLQCHEGQAEDVARARLWNLGFQSPDSASAVADFQSEVEMQEQDGELSDEVVEQIASSWAERNK
jgi:hypothetical protein